MASAPYQHTQSSDGRKRSSAAVTEDTNNNMLPLSDHNAWYYPSHGYDSEEEDLYIGSNEGNWGKKNTRGARWVRRGKITLWGPSMEEWEAEERARKRVKLLLPSNRRSPSPPSLPHMRYPSPPLESPYPQPIVQHLSYSSFVLDKAVTHTFRSSLLDELEHATNSLIEGEATMGRALGRLWQVLREDQDERTNGVSLVPKREDEDEDPEEQDDKDRRLARAPDLKPPSYKHFLDAGPPVFDTPQSVSPERQHESLEKSLATLRELEDDGREYVERLEEIREGLGETRDQRNGTWEMVRQKAVKELQDAAFSMSV